MDLRKMMFNAMLGFVPDILIAWGYAKLTDGGWQDFWIARNAAESMKLCIAGIEFRDLTKVSFPQGTGYSSLPIPRKPTIFRAR